MLTGHKLGTSWLGTGSIAAHLGCLSPSTPLTHPAGQMSSLSSGMSSHTSSAGNASMVCWNGVTVIVMHAFNHDKKMTSAVHCHC